MSINKKFLIIVPAGDNSLHKYWYDSRIYDLYVIYFGDNKKIRDDYKKKADFFRSDKGPKWQLIRRTIKMFNINKYHYVWLPDDDLEITKKNVEEFLLISQKYNLKISQPSLNIPEVNENDLLKEVINWKYNIIFPKKNIYKKKNNKIIDKILNFLDEQKNNLQETDEALINNLFKILFKWKNVNYPLYYLSWMKYFSNNKNRVNNIISEFISHKLLMQRYQKSDKIIRYTTFIEIMCPLLNVSFFNKIFYLIDNDYVKSGYGLDECWSIYLNNNNEKNMAVIDYIPVIHTRKIGLFQKKKEGNYKILTLDPKEERKLTIKKFKEKFYYLQKKNIYTISLNKKKIAFLFLTIGDVNYPSIWKDYFKNNEDKINIYIHPKNPKDVKSFFKNYIIDYYVQTKWGHISIVESMCKLLFVAMQNGQNEYFVFRSESCLPIKKFIDFYNFMLKINKSIFILGNNKGQHLSKIKYIKNTELKFNNNFYKGETWSILTRKHAQTILREASSFMYLFEDVHVPEEHFNPTIITMKHGKKSILNLRSTIVYWKKEFSKHPHTFGPIMSNEDQEYLEKNITKDTFFARKFIYGEKNNVKEIIENFLLK
jgi:hypothetical protein